VSDDGISNEVKTFIRQNISSIEQLEVLLLLHRDPSREWTASELSRELYVSPEAAVNRLKDFCARGFCVAREAEEPRYRYSPSIGHLDSVIRDLEIVYEQRRVRVINLIFSNPNDHLRSFSDAFKLRKDGEE